MAINNQNSSPQEHDAPLEKSSSSSELPQVSSEVAQISESSKLLVCEVLEKVWTFTIRQTMNILRTPIEFLLILSDICWKSRYNMETLNNLYEKLTFREKSDEKH